MGIRREHRAILDLAIGFGPSTTHNDYKLGENWGERTEPIISLLLTSL
jgi:hypothetical protein